MGNATLIRFLLGQRPAIATVAACPASLWVGALLVLSAGFAREYDQKDLLHDFGYVLVPLVASLTTSFVLFCLIYLAVQTHATTPTEFLPSYRHFLSLYWMTAPLAWIYAIPVENFLNAADAMRANLSFLGLVSLWRVLLISRCASVVFGSPYIASLFLVMLFADTLALVILFFTPLPVFNIMGGIPLTESEQVIRRVACDVQFFGGVSWLIWFIGSMVVLGSNKRKWVPLHFENSETARVSKPLWVTAVMALLVWTPVLPYSQPQQQLRREVEDDLLNGRLELALATMSSHERYQFPPHWDPPPWHGYGQDTPPLVNVLQAIDEESTAEWIKDIYFEKLARCFRSLPWSSLDDESFATTIGLLRIPRYHDIVRQNAESLRNLSQYQYDDDPERQAQIAELLTDLGIRAKADEGSDSREPADDAGAPQGAR